MYPTRERRVAVITKEHEKHYCTCPPETVHIGGHWGSCCSCIKCGDCHKWVQQRYWPLHELSGGCPRRIEVKPKQALDEPEYLEIALQDFSQGDASVYDAGFQRAMRRCVGELINYFIENSGEWFDPPSRTAAWAEVNKIFLSGKSDEERLEELLLLFEERERDDDLRAHLMFIIIMIDRNNPNPLDM